LEEKRRIVAESFGGPGEVSATARRGEHPQAHMAMLKALDRAHRFLDDGCICLSNNAAEWAVRGIAMTDSFCTSFSSV
jgi:transposase